MLSGAQATGRDATADHSPLSPRRTLGNGDELAEQPLADALKPHVPDVSWRVGGDW